MTADVVRPGSKSSRPAQDVLIHARILPLDKEAHAAFARALDAPPAPPEKLRKLMRAKSPWRK